MEPKRKETGENSSISREMCSDKEDHDSVEQRTVVSLEEMKNCDLATQAGTSEPLADKVKNAVNFNNYSLLNHYDMTVLKAFTRSVESHTRRKYIRSSAVSETFVRLSALNSNNQKNVHCKEVHSSSHGSNVQHVDVPSYSRNLKIFSSTSRKLIGINARKSHLIKKKVKPLSEKTTRAKFESLLLFNGYKDSLKQSKQFIGNMNRQLLRPIEEILDESEIKFRSLWKQIREKRKNESQLGEPQLKVQKVNKYALQKRNQNSLDSADTSIGAHTQVLAERRLNQYRFLLTGAGIHRMEDETVVVQHAPDCKVKVELLNQQMENNEMILAKPASAALSMTTEPADSDFNITAVPADSSFSIKTEPRNSSFTLKTESGNSSFIIKSEQIDKSLNMKTEPDSSNFSMKLEPKESHEQDHLGKSKFENEKARTITSDSSTSAAALSYSPETDTKISFPSSKHSNHTNECDSDNIEPQ